MARTGSASTERMRPRAMVDSTSQPWASPAKGISPAYRAVPVTFSRPSIRVWAVPTALVTALVPVVVVIGRPPR